MLKSWSIENFKPIVNSGTLQFAPVTVLAGRNSSGKSSLIQSILMVAQTLANQIPDRALLPNGPLVQLGTFEDILNEFSHSKALILGFELKKLLPPFLTGIVDLDITSAKINVKFNESDSNDTNSAVDASKSIVENVLLELKIDKTSKLSLDVNRISDDDLSSFMRNVPQGYLSIARSHINKPATYAGIIKKQDGRSSTLYLTSLSHFLPLGLFNPDNLQSAILPSIPGEMVFSTNKDEDDIGEAIWQIIRFFASKIRYLGPLRADPGTTQQQFAPTSQIDEVGTKGEYAAVVYHANQNAVIEWYNPVEEQVEQSTLKEALDTWSQYLNIANKVGTEMAGPGGVIWKVVLKEGRKPRTLPEVGVGISQILPILVMGLLAPDNSLLIVEQPELHLHPTVQARLGDFFVGQSKCQKQFLIETHSENLVSQLRYHIVESGGMEKSDCMIYFVDQDEKGAAQFDPVQISARGNILNWPDGFFDETLRQQDRITAASLRQRAKIAKNE